MPHLDKLISNSTGIPVIVAEDPLTCVARGGGQALEIMDKVKDIGEILFDYQDKIKEGDYLKICNLLQGIVKDSNHL